MGLTGEEIEAIINQNKISDSLVNRLATALNTTESNTRRFVKSLHQQIISQGESSRSHLWQACFSAGRWSTPEQSQCTSPFLKGCSPQTGAALCYIN
jgi:hypothetical protein